MLFNPKMKVVPDTDGDFETILVADQISPIKAIKL
jgi:hypothetical protein